MLVLGCARKEEAAIASTAVAGEKIELVCSYAPSQSAIVSQLASLAGGSSGTAFAVAKAVGLTAVKHSSGTYIFTGVNGYVAGSLGSAALMPIITVGGSLAGGVAITVELLCAPRNHPALVKKVEAAAQEFVERSKHAAVQHVNAAKAGSIPFFEHIKKIAIETEEKAHRYANRASIAPRIAALQPKSW